ncbi:LysR family transcriptional regulator [Luteolibacter pohnpeiensis]|uniref:LysR family transcriptional regulator n=1 Tax=Luteolibacter pohnpeiensis TaxID=454153 RepID=A0A934VT95_9BACT|nr:LysR family transcriptional regulator [Luteolibacter pohnpeiensis]MBK1881257.1 LysR family transcriptional regulator [Luteolibacter pohnpeiensis]
MIDDLRVLRAFVAVAEELNFRKAAERLHMSQPPLSRMISTLEDQIDAQLFVRSTRKVELTRAGWLFLEEARSLLDAAAAAGRRIRHEVSSQARPLRVGSTSSAYFTGLPELMNHFGRTEPSMAVEMVGMNSADQLEALASGNLDVGFVLPPVLHSELSSVLFASVRLQLAVRDDHPLAKEPGAVSLNQFRHETFILHQRAQDPGMFEGILRCCERSGFRPKIRVKTEQEHCMGLVTSGAGIHFSAAPSMCLKMSGISFIDLDGEAPCLEISMAWRTDDPSPALASFLKAASTRSIAEPTAHRTPDSR